MANAAYADYRRNTSQAAGGRNVVLRGRVVAAPASPADKVRVEAVNDASTGTLELGEASWPRPPAGKELPAAGDECLVALDDESRPWIVAWATPNWG